MNPSPNVSIFDTPEEVAQACAGRFVDYSIASIADHGSFAVALAGGSTPRRAYELIAANERSHRLSWPHIHLFFGDERMVPPESPESNYRLAFDALIGRVAIPPGNVHRINGEGAPPESTASYEADLKEFFGPVDWPRFDLVLLGMGSDGHTASLFPGSEALNEKAKWVIETRHPQTGQPRISLTFPVINNAARIIFMVTGKEKAATLARVLHGEPADDELPARLVRPVNGTLEWLVDRAAAGEF